MNKPFINEQFPSLASLFSQRQYVKGKKLSKSLGNVPSKIVKLTYLESLCMNGFLAAKITGFCLRYLLTNIKKNYHRMELRRESKRVKNENFCG